MKWAVAINTAPRKDCTLQRCLDSVRACGWEPIIFAEPGSTIVDAETVQNTERMGVWHNWRQASSWALLQNADAILTIQDDAVFHPDAKTFTESILWPSPNTGYISLYTPKHYQHWKDGRKRAFGVYEVKTNSVWGAMSLVFPPDSLRKLLEHPRALSWTGAKISRKSGEKIEDFKKRWEQTKQKRSLSPHLIQNSDTAIGIILRKHQKKKLMYVSPSPVDHISRYSSIGHGGNEGRRNAYYIADHSIPLADQVNNELSDM